jgi:hypothetical protein
MSRQPREDAPFCGSIDPRQELNPVVMSGHLRESKITGWDMLGEVRMTLISKQGKLQRSSIDSL